MDRECDPAADGLEPAEPGDLRVVLLSRDVSLDEAHATAFDVPRMVLRGSVTSVANDARPQSLPPDLVVLDCTGVPDHGFGLLVGAHRRWPDARVLLLDAPEDPAWLAKAVRLGVRGALPPGYDRAEVSVAAERIRQGELWFSRKLTQQILSIEVQEHHSLLVEHIAESPLLTDRERDVARHAVRGLSNAEIAAALGIRESNVQELVLLAYRKLRKSRRSELLLRLALGHRFEAA